MAWTVVARTADIGDRGVIGVRSGGHRLAVYRLDGEYFATHDTCPHANASLSHGCIAEGYIECPMHHALFDIRTGATDGSVTPHDIRTYAIRVEGDEILVDLDA